MLNRELRESDIPYWEKLGGICFLTDDYDGTLSDDSYNIVGDIYDTYVNGVKVNLKVEKEKAIFPKNSIINLIPKNNNDYTLSYEFTTQGEGNVYCSLIPENIKKFLFPIPKAKNPNRTGINICLHNTPSLTRLPANIFKNYNKVGLFISTNTYAWRAPYYPLENAGINSFEEELINKLNVSLYALTFVNHSLKTVPMDFFEKTANPDLWQQNVPIHALEYFFKRENLESREFNFINFRKEEGDYYFHKIFLSFLKNFNKGIPFILNVRSKTDVFYSETESNSDVHYKKIEPGDYSSTYGFIYNRVEA